MIIMSIFCYNANTFQGQIVLSLDSYDPVSLSDPELATEQVLDRSHSNLPQMRWGWNIHRRVEGYWETSGGGYIFKRAKTTKPCFVVSALSSGVSLFLFLFSTLLMITYRCSSPYTKLV